MKKLGLTIIPLMLLSSLLLVPTVGHGSLVGNVNINGGTTVFTATTATTVTVPINIAGSDALNGFDIQVKTDTSVLQPTGVSLSGSILSSGGIAIECLNGVLVAGTTCSPQDGLGVVHVAVARLGPNISPPVSGLLFSINYKIVSLTVSSPIAFNTGCTSTSIVGTSDCVTILNGTLTPASETDTNALFQNLITFSETPAFTSVSTPSGVSISDLINYVALGGYTDFVDESVATTSGLTATLSTGTTTNTVDLSSSTTASDTLTISGSTSGSVTVTATGEGFCPCGVVTQSATVNVLIAPKGFSISLSQTFVKISRGSSDSSTMINLKGVSGFGGTVTFSSSAASGISGSAPMATLTADGSGYSTASSTLTITVGSGVATGNYTLTVMGMSGSSSSSASITVSVPGQDFRVIPVPANIVAIRGGSVVSTIVVQSLGNFAGPVSLTASVNPVANQQDSCCLTNNTSPTFSSNTAVLTAGSTVQIGFFAGTVGGTAPAAQQTSTGNYTVTITGTSGSIIHSVIILFAIVDFTLGPAYCPGLNIVPTTPSDYGAIDLGGQFISADGTFSGQFVGPKCTSLTITDEPLNVSPFLGGGLFGPVAQAQLLWLQTNALGGLNGLVTNGWNGTPAIALINHDIPVNGVTVPALATFFPPNGTIIKKLPWFWPDRACLVATFAASNILSATGAVVFTAGQQIPYSYLATNGPIVIPGTGIWPFLSSIIPKSIHPGTANWGCKFDAATFPNDAGIVNSDPLYGAIGCTDPNDPKGLLITSDDCGLGLAVPRYNNPDYNAIMATALTGTLPGSYSFQVCGQFGVLFHCQTFGLNVIKAPIVHQIVYSKTVSVKAGVQTLKMGITNADLTNTIFAQVTISALGSNGDTLSATATVTIAPNTTVNNIALSFDLTTLAGPLPETFSFSVSVQVGLDNVNFDGFSSLTNGVFKSAEFTVTS